MTSEELAQNLNLLYGDYLILIKKEEALHKETQETLTRAKAVNDPRKEFNRWLQTKVGKSWKSKQFDRQEGRCAACGESLRFADTVVHHVLPLKDFGSSANRTENFKLLHPSCNLRIGTKIVDFS